MSLSGLSSSVRHDSEGLPDSTQNFVFSPSRAHALSVDGSLLSSSNQSPINSTQSVVLESKRPNVFQSTVISRPRIYVPVRPLTSPNAPSKTESSLLSEPVPQTFQPVESNFPPPKSRSLSLRRSEVIPLRSLSPPSSPQRARRSVSNSSESTNTRAHSRSPSTRPRSPTILSSSSPKSTEQALKMFLLSQGNTSVGVDVRPHTSPEKNLHITQPPLPKGTSKNQLVISGSDHLPPLPSSSRLDDDEEAQRMLLSLMYSEKCKTISGPRTSTKKGSQVHTELSPLTLDNEAVSFKKASSVLLDERNPHPSSPVLPTGKGVVFESTQPNYIFTTLAEEMIVSSEVGPNMGPSSYPLPVTPYIPAESAGEATIIKGVEMKPFLLSSPMARSQSPPMRSKVQSIAPRTHSRVCPEKSEEVVEFIEPKIFSIEQFLEFHDIFHHPSSNKFIFDEKNPHSIKREVYWTGDVITSYLKCTRADDLVSISVYPPSDDPLYNTPMDAFLALILGEY